MKQITANFNLAELTATTKTGLLNNPDADQLHYLTLLCEKVLQPLRYIYGKPIHINSAFRSVLVNKAVKGAKTSQHLKGKAVDIDNGREENIKLFNILKTMDFDQLINESDYSWIHCSYNPNANRKQILNRK